MVPPGTERVALARILRARGRRGEVAAEILTDFPARLTALREVFLHDEGRPGVSARRIVVRSAWLHNGRVIFHFEGVDSIAAAEALAGLLVEVPIAERVALPAGSYYVSELIGCEVFEKEASTLGLVRDVQFTGGAPLLVVDTPRGELLIPLAEEICVRIDPPARRIDVFLPAGLKELNLP